MFEDYTLPAGASLLLALLGGLPEKSILFGGPRKTPMSPWKSRLFARGVRSVRLSIPKGVECPS